jgi:hypothetical protein
LTISRHVAEPLAANGRSSGIVPANEWRRGDRQARIDEWRQSEETMDKATRTRAAAPWPFLRVSGCVLEEHQLGLALGIAEPRNAPAKALRAQRCKKVTLLQWLGAQFKEEATFGTTLVTAPRNSNTKEKGGRRTDLPKLSAL